MKARELDNLRSKIQWEGGMEPTFIDYSDFPEIEDEEFHKLRKAFCDAHAALKDYLGID